MQGRLLSLKRSASNIIGNVVKYGQTAKVSITEVGENFAVTVEDGGPGIAESDRKRVFHPFVRSEETCVRQAGGSGLGLAIVKRIVGDHHGRLDLANREPAGAVARMEFDLAANHGLLPPPDTATSDPEQVTS